eukprot:GFKZ01009879.1.p1 GENE.GFKZ01009879.1~~GFKZ01009879.1.p1  ORF type:complete len:116 (-),score=22.41 GFKZ01009879.1:678-1025(-)
MAVTHRFQEEAVYDFGWRRQMNQQARVKVASLLFTELSGYYSRMSEMELKEIAASAECEAFFGCSSLHDYLRQIAHEILEAKKGTQNPSTPGDQQAEQVNLESGEGSECTAAAEK